MQPGTPVHDLFPFMRGRLPRRDFARTWSRSPERRGGGLWGGGALWGGLRGGSPPADFSIPAGGFSGGFFWRIFPLYFATKKRPPQNPPQNPPLRGEFLFQKSPGLEAPEIHRPPPPPPRESKSKSCAFGSGTVTFQGRTFQEKTPGLIGPRNLRILIGRIAVGWPCMECHVPCHIGIYRVRDSVKQSEGWGKNPALIARSPTRHSKCFIEKFHYKSSLLVWLPNWLPQVGAEIWTQRELFFSNFSGSPGISCPGVWYPWVWDPSFPLEDTNKIPPPRKSWQNSQKLQFGPPQDCPENYRKRTKKLLKVYFFGANVSVCLFFFSNFSVIFRTVPGWAKL